MAEIAGRLVKIRTGNQTQTVNICFRDEPVEGKYEFKYRIGDPSIFLYEQMLTLMEFDNLESLRDFLLNHGAIEEAPGSSQFSRQQLLDNTSAMPEGIIKQLDDQVDAFLDTFIKSPYMHRVEHSIHVDLFNRIAALSDVAERNVEITNGFKSSLVHKEWPEPSRINAAKRRGSHDIALLPPCNPSVEQFCLGYIRPFAAFELGLNYNVAHFDKDVYTLHYAKLRTAYVIHLAREEAQNQEQVIERVQALLDAGHHGNDGWPKLAVAILGPDGRKYLKYARESQFRN
jgi:hypothetical protein